MSSMLMGGDGRTEVIEMRGKRSGEIYKEVMSAIRAEDLNGELAAAKEKGQKMAKPYLKWVWGWTQWKQIKREDTPKYSKA